MSSRTLDLLRAHWLECPGVGLTLDLSRMGVTPDLRAAMRPRLEAALGEMARLEGGAVANPDEGRRVGHYWLRAPELAPDAELAADIRETVDRVKAFAQAVRTGSIRALDGGVFEELLVIGIGGSALGPQLVADALGHGSDRIQPRFLDNTYPDGIDRVLDALGPFLARTLTLVVSKSGGTKETRNGMLEAMAAYERAGLAFGPHAVAVTGEGSELEKLSRDLGFLARFPMWDWVGGRTSVTSAVGLLPAALQGLDVDALLAGAAAMDDATRAPDPDRNPAAALALGWYAATDGQARRAMVVLPYKDRLALLGRYLQQLVMESLGKRHDRHGREVRQGLTVYGNKGSTDQHAYVQQLRDGPDDMFALFVEVLENRSGHRSIEVEPGVTTGDYLEGFLLGTREALTEAGRKSATLTLDRVDARSLGATIALFERAVGLYASLVDVNAYHQPGVEAGKKAASEALALQGRILAVLAAAPSEAFGLEELAETAAGPIDVTVSLLRHLHANGRIRRLDNGHGSILDARWGAR